MRFYVLAAFLAFSAMGCGSGESKKYQYSVNGCDTGEHSFDSTASYCEGLRSNSLNNGCAAGFRQEAYERDCGKAFFPTT